MQLMNKITIVRILYPNYVYASKVDLKYGGKVYS